MTPLDLLVIAAYGLIVFELTFLPVPSEASSYQLLATKHDAFSDRNTDSLGKARSMTLGQKVLAFLLPTSLCVTVFLLPLVQIVHPPLGEYLLPISFFDQALFEGMSAVLIVVGSAVTLVSVLELRTEIANSTKNGSNPGLRIRGTFALSRNPGLVGNFILFFGFFLFLPTFIMALGFCAYVLSMHYRVLLEESYLAGRFGDVYLRYKQQVPRYLTFSSVGETKHRRGT